MATQAHIPSAVITDEVVLTGRVVSILSLLLIGLIIVLGSGLRGGIG